MPGGNALEPLGDLRPNPVAVVTTESSVWLLDDRCYVRLPRTELPAPTRSAPSPWGRLDDGQRLEHRGAAWVREPSGALHVRIWPTAGPAGGEGVMTGRVVMASGLAVDDPLAATFCCSGDPNT